MHPSELGEKYDKISHIYQSDLKNSKYGLEQVDKAIEYSSKAGLALDVGCGVGGRIVHKLEQSGFSVTGVDVSNSMITLAEHEHPNIAFHVADICTWETARKFDFIVAWDSLFHLPCGMHEAVLRKLSGLLATNGVLIYTFGNAVGEHVDTWHNDTFYYSSIGIKENLKTIMAYGLSPLHLELDQYPEKHAFIIATRT